MLTRFAKIAFLAITAFAANLAWASADDCPMIPDFHAVHEGVLYRGARPGRPGLRCLANLGIKTDLDIENDPGAIAREREFSDEYGIRMISIPLSGFWSPKETDVQRIVSIMEDPAYLPLYVHCKHGHDRTGLAVGIYRITHDGWSANDAFTEMLKLHFHTVLLGLTHYFCRISGLSPCPYFGEPLPPRDHFLR